MILVSFAAVSAFIAPRILALASASIAFKIFATSFKSLVIVSKIAAACFGFIVDYILI